MSSYKTPTEVSQSIRDFLYRTDPDWNTNVGSTTRKIIDAASQMISEAYMETYLADLHQDLDYLNGLNLDNFVSNFGFSRRPARPSSGIVKFICSESGGASRSYFIPAGTRVSTSPGLDVLPLFFETTQSFILERGATQAEIPVRSSQGGSVFNVSTGEIKILISTFAWPIGSVINDEPMTGGANLESDEELRERFRNTVFHNVVGTKDAYEGMALSFTDDCRNARAFGQSTTFDETVQFTVVGPDMVAYLSKPNIYSTSEYVWTIDGSLLPNGSKYYQEGIDYVLDLSTPNAPKLVAPAGSAILDPSNPDRLAIVEYEYKSLYSRAGSGQYGRNVVDVYVVGQHLDSASDIVKHSTSLVDGTGRPMHKLCHQPVVTLPDVIYDEDENMYEEGTDYELVKDDNSNGNAESWRANDYVRWKSGGSQPANDKRYNILNYNWNALPFFVGQVITQDNKKQITTDVLVHNTQEVYMEVNICVMYTNDAPDAAVDQAIIDSIENYLGNIMFGNVVQFSDIITIAYVNGVDNVRWTTSSEDATDYGIRIFDRNGDPSTHNGNSHYTGDFRLQDNEVGALRVVNITPKAQNTW